ncbi:MAG: glycosyltransferase family 2 protein [Phycisphaerales bacterium]|nr:MAG: glycosyltransferase family 2 protein [Phycisphaerales bacterium]
MPVSIFIQTLNEGDNLPGLLDSLEGFDDIVVLDSLSTDGTKQIARERGCRWYERAYDGRGPHQNWAMENIDFRHKWVFYLDADERMTPQLKDEILAIADDANEKRVAFYCGRRNYFMGKWIKRAMPPGYIMRFFQPPHIRFARMANPIPTVTGEVGYLKQQFIHYNFSKGLHEWLERHNRYSSYEAQETVRALKERPLKWGNLFSSDAMTRRFEMKNLSFRLPGRPIFKFLYLYLLKRGFLDGRAGLTYCMLQAIYEYHICIKVRELKRQEAGLPPS